MIERLSEIEVVESYIEKEVFDHLVPRHDQMPLDLDENTLEWTQAILALSALITSALALVGCSVSCAKAVNNGRGAGTTRRNSRQSERERNKAIQELVACYAAERVSVNDRRGREKYSMGRREPRRQNRTIEL